jgi:hypothetical protein
MCEAANQDRNMQVFISYSRWNKYFASQLHTDLKRLGWEPWLDNRNIAINAEWQKAIEEAICRSNKFILLWSPEAEKSPWVAVEFNMASNQSKISRCIARISGSESDLPEEKAKLQLIDATDNYEISLGRIVNWLAGAWKNVAHPRKQLVTNASIGQVATATHAPQEETDLIKIFSETGKSGAARRTFIHLPIDVSGYSAAYYLGEKDSIPGHSSDLAVILKFSADPSRNTVEDVLSYLLPTGPVNLAIVFYGPRHDREYNLPDEKAAIWTDAIRLIVRVLQCYGQGKTLHVFMDAPNALAFSIALEFGKFAAMRIYNLNRAGIKAERYTQVFSYPRSSEA